MRKISVLSDNGSLYSRFTVSGQRYTLYYPTSDFTKCELIAKTIQHDVEQGRFDPTLDSYKGEKGGKSKRLESLIQMWCKWITHLNLTQKTLNVHYVPISCKIPSSAKVGSTDWLEKTAEKWSNDTWNQRIGRVKAFGEWLRDEGYLPVNPYRHLKRKESERKEYVPFTLHEMRSIVEELKKRNGLAADFYYFLMLTGCRPSEAIGLRWKDVDFDKGEISISSALARGERGGSNPSARVRKSTKTGVSNKVPISEELKAILKHRLPQASTRDNSQKLVFQNSLGNSFDDRNALNRYWKPALEALGLDYRVPYNARHTAASQLLRQGIPAFEVAKALRTSVSMIERHYGHLMPGELPLVKYEE